MKLLDNRLLVRVQEGARRTASGIIIPDSAQTRPSFGTVVQAGPGAHDPKTGELVPCEVQEGDCVLFGRFAGSPFHHEGEDLLVLREIDVFGIL